jgi:UDP-N-acetylglucosamine/UDP-N-acetylgalactosamine 4-epimerase
MFKEWIHGRDEVWLVTGAAGFIGSNLCVALLEAGQKVVGLDNFETGHRDNVRDIEDVAAAQAQASFRFIEGDIRDAEVCNQACQGVTRVLHQAALGSVPRSIKTPLLTHAANVDGFINMLNAAVTAKVKRFVYASSSSVYGDSPDLPKVESKTGAVLSPYAATKAINELYAGVFQRTYGIECVGLRYFNVFGPRQDPRGAYAAVIPKWAAALMDGEPVVVNGDGSTSRDFCYVGNAVQANLHAALTPDLPPSAQVFNVAFGQQTTLLELANAMREELGLAMGRAELTMNLQHQDFRAGDIRHSLADIAHAQRLLRYAPEVSIAQGLRLAMPWYVKNRKRLQ